MSSPDSTRLFLAALTGIALLRTLSPGSESKSLLPTLGRLKILEPHEEAEFELMWADAAGTVLEGQFRTRIVPQSIPEVLSSLTTEWEKLIVDESSTGAGDGTVELWVRKSAVRKRKISSTWAFRSGRPIRTSKIILRSGRQIWGVL